jgi:hypothetical protein
LHKIDHHSSGCSELVAVYKFKLKLVLEKKISVLQRKYRYKSSHNKHSELCHIFHMKRPVYSGQRFTVFQYIGIRNDPRRLVNKTDAQQLQRRTDQHKKNEKEHRPLLFVIQ